MRASSNEFQSLFDYDDWNFMVLAGAMLIAFPRLREFLRDSLEQRCSSRSFSIWLVVALLGSWLTASPALAGDAPIEAFYGTYVGTVTSTEDGDAAPRETKVSIKPQDDGFNVRWSTTKAKGQRKSYSIDFEPTKRPGIFGSAMRRNKFGDSVPLDPLKGDSYVWARISGQTLTVYGLLITEEGSYEMQVYHRTLWDEGLDLKFFRYLEGEPVRLISGRLARIEE